MNKPWESPNELAHRVGVSVALIRRMLKDNELDHIYPTPSAKHVRIPIGSWEKRFGVSSSSLKPKYKAPNASHLPSTNSSLGFRLRTLRRELEMSQENFSESIGCSRSAYQHYERGDRDVPSSIVAQISVTHKVDLHWLLLDATEENSSDK